MSGSVIELRARMALFGGAEAAPFQSRLEELEFFLVQEFAD